MRDDLLKPVLTGEDETTPSLSMRAMFFVAFFGGPFAVTFFSAINSYLMSRLRKDAAIYAALTLAGMAILAVQSSNPEIFNIGKSGSSTENFKFIWRITALLFMGVFYLLHRKNYRVAHTFGHQFESPWVYGIFSVVIGIVLAAAVGVATQWFTIKPGN